MSVEKRLLNIRQKMKEHKQEKAEAEGAVKVKLKELKTNHKVTGTKQARLKVKKLNTKVDSFTKKINLGVKELEANYDI